jgi:hypothetical protein
LCIDVRYPDRFPRQTCQLIDGTYI